MCDCSGAQGRYDEEGREAHQSRLAAVIFRSILSELLFPCSSAHAGTLWRYAPALTPRAAYGKAIRHIVPLKKGTERNTTAQDTMLHLSFPAPFFLFHFYRIPARLCFSICFFNLFPILVTAWSLPPSHVFYLTLPCLWVLRSTVLIFTLIQRAFTFRSPKSPENSLNSKKSRPMYFFP